MPATRKIKITYEGVNTFNQPSVMTFTNNHTFKDKDEYDTQTIRWLERGFGFFEPVDGQDSFKMIPASRIYSIDVEGPKKEV